MWTPWSYEFDVGEATEIGSIDDGRNENDGEFEAYRCTSNWNNYGPDDTEQPLE